MTKDARDIAADLAYMAGQPELFTKTEMAAMLAKAAETIETLRARIGIRAAIELEDVEPEGNA